MTLISISKYYKVTINFYKIENIMVLMKNYELIILLTDEFNENEVKSWVFNLAKLLRQYNISNVSVISLGKLKLSYPIKNKVKGTYIQCNFSAIPNFINDMLKILKMDLRILRLLIINKDK